VGGKTGDWWREGALREGGDLVGNLLEEKGCRLGGVGERGGKNAYRKH